MLKIVKFGGSSLAEAENFRNVKKIIELDASRSVVVVSAPGKSKIHNDKITDLLIKCSAQVQDGENYGETLSVIESRYSDICAGLGLKPISGEFDKIRENIINKPDYNYIVSRGEYLCARVMSEYIGADFTDAAGSVFFDENGKFDEAKTYAAIRAAFERSSGKIVIPGFYGSMPDGSIKLMTRGGSDVTGAYAAAALDCDVYENWTDVAGILMTDPKIVENPLPIPNISFDELRDMTFLGANVLHEETVIPLREKKIPINIRNTFAPYEQGTLISAESGECVPERRVTGIAGKGNFSLFTVSGRRVSPGYIVLHRMLELFETNGVPVENTLFGVDSISFVTPGDGLAPKLEYISCEIEKLCGNGSVHIRNGISKIAVIGCHPGCGGIYGRVLDTVSECGIEILMIYQSPGKANIVLGVDEKDYRDAVRAIYHAVTE